VVPWLHRVAARFSPMLAYLDAGFAPAPPPVVASHLDGSEPHGPYSDGLSPAHICMWVGRVHDETSFDGPPFPDNPDRQGVGHALRPRP